MLRVEKWPCSTQEETAGALGEEYGHPSPEATVELMRLALTELNQTAPRGPAAAPGPTQAESRVASGALLWTQHPSSPAFQPRDALSL